MCRQEDPGKEQSSSDKTGEPCRQDEEAMHVPDEGRTPLARTVEENRPIYRVVLYGNDPSFFLHHVIAHCVKLLMCSKHACVFCSAHQAQLLNKSPSGLAFANTFIEHTFLNKYTEEGDDCQGLPLA